RLLTGEDLLVDNNVARLAIHGDLRAVGPITSPSAIGRMEFGEGGTVFFNGTRYRLSDRRTIDFANATRIEPDLDLSAVARVKNYEIAIGLKGTPATLETSLSSDDLKPDGTRPSDSELVSLLLVGEIASGSEMASAYELMALLKGNVLETA